MIFKPLGNRYNYSPDVLVKSFPDYFYSPIDDWLWKVLNSAGAVDVSDSYIDSSKRYIKTVFLNRLQIYFREVFPQYWKEAFPFIFQDPDRLSNFLAFCLQNFADGDDATELEYILSQGGSGFGVIKTQKDASEYTKGVYDLVERVGTTVKEQSAKALDDNEILMAAWIYCYSRNPDYEKVVSRSCDFLESFLGKKYFPTDPKPQLKKFIHSFEEHPALLDYKGNSIVKPKSNLTSLLKEASDIRGQHTAGKGRKPTKQEAEFVLHATIFIWNLHQK